MSGASWRQLRLQRREVRETLRGIVWAEVRPDVSGSLSICRGTIAVNRQALLFHHQRADLTDRCSYARPQGSSHTHPVKARRSAGAECPEKESATHTTREQSSNQPCAGATHHLRSYLG